MDAIGVAISGGGHRATVWGLGALLRLVDCGANENTVSIASVSGGSIANGIVAHELDFRTASRQRFESAIRPGLRNIAHDGLLFFGPATNAYVFAVLAVGFIAALLLLGLLVVAVLNAFREPDLAISVRALTGGVAMSLVAFLLLLSRRSRVTDVALARVHFHEDDCRPTLLRSIRRATHHVFCTTELQAADHCYFTPSGVYSYRLGVGTPGDLPLSTAVQCSACMPLGFAPRTLKTDRFQFVPPSDIREPPTPPERIVLSDGGVYDNMADQWEQGFVSRISRWPELPSIQQKANVLLIVNASKGWTWRPLRRLGILSAEVVGFLRPIRVMYDVTTSRRRFEVIERFTNAELTGTGLRGALIHIAQSPYTVPDRMLKDRDPSRVRRAAEAITFLDGTGSDRPSWQARADADSRVPTVLSALGEKTTVDLLEHAYMLAMINLYVILGIGTLQPLNRDRLKALCS